MKNNLQKIKKNNSYSLFVLLLIFCIYQYGIQKICGFTLYPDEFGYWASAANAIGYNWSEVASMSSYYSFGYSLILMPVLKIFVNSVAAYKAAVTVNMLLMCISVLLMQKVIFKLFPDIEKVKSVFLSSIAVLYPAWIFYMQMTMTESLLFFLFVLISYLFLYMLEKPRVLTAVMLATALIYIYCVHMRTVGMVIACILTCVLWGIVNAGEKKRAGYTILFFITLAVAGWIALKMKNKTILEVFAYAEKDVLAGNDYGSQIAKLNKILTFQGMIQLLKEMVGKIFYLGLSSFGFFYWAAIWCMKECTNLLRKIVYRESPFLKQWMALFLLLSALAEILISSIYMYGAGNVDCLIYGRYDEFVLPVMIAVGIIAMEKSSFLFLGTVFAGIFSGVLSFMLLNVIEIRNMKGLRGYHIAGLSYLIKENSIDIYFFFRDTWILCFGIMLIVCFLVWLNRRLKRNSWILAGIMVIEIIAGLQISEHYVYSANNVNFENQIIVETILENCNDKDKIVYLDEGYPEFIDFLQMQLREKSISVVTERTLKREALPEFIVTHVDTQMGDFLQEVYDSKVTANTLNVYFNKNT
ncbi:MAG: hypothetical protein HDR71_18425 [Lachnospiraceae bacterium]|nr:hypothetical protein [Lachnospiraceae bacterium]